MSDSNSQTGAKILSFPKVGRVEKIMRIFKGIGKEQEDAPIETMRNRAVDKFIEQHCGRKIMKNAPDAPRIDSNEALKILRQAIAPLQKKIPFVETFIVEIIRSDIAEFGYEKIAFDEMDFGEDEKCWIYGFDYCAAAEKFFFTNKTDPENNIAGFIHTPPRTFRYVPARLENAFILFHIVLAIYRLQWNENVTRRIDNAVAE